MSDEKPKGELGQLSPQTIEALARIVPEEQLALFDTELAAAITKARQTVARQDAVAASLVRGGRREKVKMDDEQQGEWLRCAVLGLQGKSFMVDTELDTDGLITQSLGPATDSAGGYAIPDDFVGRINHAADEPSIVWPLIRKYGTSKEIVTQPKESSFAGVSKGTASKASSTTFSDELTETAIVMDEDTWTMRYFDALVPIKLDMLDDSPINILDYVTRRVGDKFGIEREREPIIGSGSSRPIGMCHNGGTTAGITTVAISAALTLTNLLDDFVQVIPQLYRSKATLLMGGEMLFATARLLATSVYSAQYLVNMLPPMKESAYIPNGQILGGDFSYYVVFYNRLMRMVTETSARRFSLILGFVEKWDGKVTIADAFRLATGITY